jgi:hypothetical protein
MSQQLTAAISMQVPAQKELLDNYAGRTGKFIKGFLLNDKRNKNGWMVPWDVIKKYASDFVNHPGIYMNLGGEPDHTGGGTYRENMANQEEYRVVNIIDVSADETTHTLHYTGEIIDREFLELWEAGKINMTSPAIWPIEMETVGTTDNGRPELNVSEYRALHVAYIDEPAYGRDAFTISTCDGDGEECKIRLSANSQADALTAAGDPSNLAPLQEVPLIKKTLNRTYTPCKVKEIHAEFVAMGKDEPCNANSCVSNKLKIIMQDNPGMAEDQQLAIAYSYCKKEIAALLTKDF